jgi:MFS family permease
MNKFKLNQITKFYISSFLKNQYYFAPVFIILLQFYNLTIQEVFWVFTIGSILNVLVEIPTGIFSDLYGKKKSIIISKFLIFISFIIFGFSRTFWMFVFAQMIYELGTSFRSGTETAYTFDYLKQNSKNPGYTEVKGKQKFYARIGEAIASIIGGLIAKFLGFNYVFFFAAIPAFINFLNATTWKNIKEKRCRKIDIKSYVKLTKTSFKEITKNKSLLRVSLNITLFTSILAASVKFIQPYMTEANIGIEWFGAIYATSLIIAAITVRYSYIIENYFGTIKTFNFLSALAIIPALILGLGYVSLLGVGFFFAIVIIENIRSPIENTLFHENVKSSIRATMGSMLEILKSGGKVIILPIAGFFAENFSMHISMLVLAGMILINTLLFKINSKN